MRLLRTMLFTPGNNWRMIQKAKELKSDAIILDLEDAVPIAEKETARMFVADAIKLIKSSDKQVFVRVNSLTTGLTEEDIEFSIQESLDGIVLPKTESGDDIATAEKMISRMEKQRNLPSNHTRIIPLLETARGVMNVKEILKSSGRVIAVCFGALDFTRDMGTVQSKEGSETFYARSRIAIVARANNVQAIDTPWLDLIDEEGLMRESEYAKRLGFKGKLLIHPDHVKAVNAVFSPTEKEVEHANSVVKAFEEAQSRGLGAISLNGKMIDFATYQQAKDLLNFKEAISDKEKK